MVDYILINEEAAKEIKGFKIEEKIESHYQPMEKKGKSSKLNDEGRKANSEKSRRLVGKRNIRIPVKRTGRSLGVPD